MSEALIDGIFYFWGFIENPAEKKAKETIKESPAQKMRKDMKRVNGDFNSALAEMKKDFMSIEQ
jgi:hypothetical protein